MARLPKDIDYQTKDEAYKPHFKKGLLIDYYQSGEILKSGRKSTRWSTGFVWYTPLLRCFSCNKISTPKKIQWRFFSTQTTRRWKPDDITICEPFCLGCWNKLRALEKRMHDLSDMKKEIEITLKNIKLLEKEKCNVFIKSSSTKTDGA